MGRPAQKKKRSPMLEQYVGYKEAYPDALLFFQVGDFYEAFYEDAVTAARVLNITLTSRDKNSENPVPMAGVPQAVIDGYAERLVDRGHSVAIVSQMSKPVPGKMVDRKLDRILTPGIRLLSESPGSRSGVVSALYPEHDEQFSLVYTDVQSGQLYVREGVGRTELHHEISCMDCTELLLPRTLGGSTRLDRRHSLVREIALIVGDDGVKFRALDARRNRSQVRDLNALKGFLSLGSAAQKAVQLLVSYIDETTVDRTTSLFGIEHARYDNVLILDARTRDNLELVSNNRDGSTQGTLLEYLNCTESTAGYRLLRSWIIRPSSCLDTITARLEAVQSLRGDRETRTLIRSSMQVITDLERIAARVDLLAANPAELAALRDSFSKIIEVRSVLHDVEAPRIQELVTSLDIPQAAHEVLQKTLADSPPPSVQEGGIIQSGFNEELERLRTVRTDGKAWIAAIESRERSSTGISSLKVKFNNVHGYFIEVTKANLAKVPDHYTKKQTTTSAERFVTQELKDHEEEVLNAESRQFDLERRLFQALREEIREYSSEIRVLGRIVAELDVLSSFAELAEREGLIRPEVNDSDELFIQGGKHPVLARILQEEFVPNSLSMKSEERRCLIVTGPNMGGKSTYLRQSALLVVMAQAGSFVPAHSAQIGIVDKIFARLGASDNLAEGQSTFMVEMKEAAHIVSNATRRSLLLIDEIGRGTATRDGLVIARAILEWISQRIHCRTLFATHFHELTELAARMPEIDNLSVGSIDTDGEIVFTHKIEPGPASNSYGIEVAQLAGLPAELLTRARELLLSSNTGQKKQLSIFESVPQAKKLTVPEDYQRLKDVQQKLQSYDINRMTPLEALNALESLYRAVGKKEE